MGKTVTITTTKAKFPGNLADEYLVLKAEKADLAVREKALKDKLIALGKATVEGNFGRVTISHIPGAEKIDYSGAAKALIAESRLSEFTKWQSETYRFNVRARIAKE